MFAASIISVASRAGGWHSFSVEVSYFQFILRGEKRISLNTLVIKVASGLYCTRTIAHKCNPLCQLEGSWQPSEGLTGTSMMAYK